ncbi:MAG: prepilin-type N-terminal cleavage/methylation domain-containing protein [Candidatus Omnitrophica bacterium]|nr:prepilin-type N-terminal cleavage/methylation domain-containing protein [Candidatus Omnitrophota bacterium]
MNSREQSFTLMELMIVVVIIGVIAGFAIPSYQKAIEKNEEKTAVVKLQTIRAGMKIYLAKNGGYPAFDMATVTAINANLGLSVVADTMTYQCLQNDNGETNVCTATSPDSSWSIHWHDPGGNGLIHCGAGTCPTCTVGGTGCNAG